MKPCICTCIIYTYRYIGNKVRQVNCRLQSVKPPQGITRAPKNVEHGSGWKGIHFLLYCAVWDRVFFWLLYVSIFCTLVMYWNIFPLPLSASECKLFLLYYMPFALIGILPDKFLCHALILSKAIRLLVGDAGSHADIEIAEELLRLFWRLTEKYYGTTYMYVNVYMCMYMYICMCMC